MNEDNVFETTFEKMANVDVIGSSTVIVMLERLLLRCLWIQIWLMRIVMMMKCWRFPTKLLIIWHQRRNQGVPAGAGAPYGFF